MPRDRRLVKEKILKQFRTKKYLLSLDQGTTSSRAVLFDQKARPLFQVQKEFTQYYPSEGLVEHDPEEIWQSIYQCCLQVIQKANINANEIIAIGITNQRETTTLWERKSGKPIYKSIVWQDRRSAQLCLDLAQNPQSKIINPKTGLLLDSYFSATKIKWLLEHVPNALFKAKAGELAFGTIDTFLLWKLTGGKIHATDITNASRTLLFNIYEQTWDQDLLNFFQIPPELLPHVFDNCHPFGVSDKSLLGCEIPITAMIGDQQSALFGQACFHPGMMKSTYGTGSFLLVNSGEKVIHSKNNLLSTIAYRINGKINYGLEGSIFNAGTSIKWLRDNLHLISSTSQVEELAKSVPNTNGVTFIPAFTGLGAPYWDPKARGALLGLTRDTQIAHIVRAALEAVCYQTLDLLEAMRSDGINIELLRVDGGMAVNNWLLQFLSDLLDLPIERPQYVETTAQGAAYLCGLGAGLFNSMQDIEKLWERDSQFHPHLENKERKLLYSHWKKSIERIKH